MKTIINSQPGHMEIEAVARRLRRRGYRLTPQRQAILSVFAGRHDHLSPAAIYERVHKDYPAIGLVTVYRTLEVLADLNLLCRVHDEGGCRSYLLSGVSGHHHHLVCSSCGKVADFEACDLTGLESRLSRETGFRIQSHLLEFNGLCRECCA